MENMQWEIVGAVFGVLSFILTIVIEWHKPNVRKFFFALIIGGAVFAIIYSIPSIIPASPTPTTTSQNTKTPSPTTATENISYIFDSFSNGAFDGSINNNYWIFQAGENNFTQRNGALAISTTTDSTIMSKQFSSFSINKSISYEADLKMSGVQHDGAISIKIETSDWDAECNIGASDTSSSGFAYCGTYSPTGTKYSPDGKSVAFDAWHTFRIEIEPTIMTITYFIDEEKVGSHIMEDAFQSRV